MEVYIKIEQTAGSGVLQIRFPNSKNNALWYSDSDIVFMSISSTEFKYETKYTVDAVDTATLQLKMYEVDSNQLIKTINITGDAIDDTPVLAISVSDIDLGRETTTKVLISSSISVTAENLIDDIVVTGDDDDSIFVSVDGGVTYYKGRIPIQAITWVTSNTFNMRIKRVYTSILGRVTQVLRFSNAGINSILNVTSVFDHSLIAPVYKSEPSGSEGSIYYDSVREHFYGYDGTNWKQLDN